MTSESSPKGLTWQRMVIAAIVLVTAGVAGASVWTNLSRQASQDAAYKQAAAEGAEPLEVTTSNGVYKFMVEVMRTDAQRAKGLMFRQTMPQDRGMLFDFAHDSPVSMWMKNTYIPLDMVFILADGKVHRVERRTEPHSERTISSGGAVRAVLEVNAGVSDRIGLKPGDRITHPMFPAK